MTKNNSILINNIFPASLLVFLVILSSFIFKNGIASPNIGEVKGAETSKNSEPSFSHSINSKMAKVNAVISAITGMPFQPDSDPLHSIQGEFRDINNDGKKEFISRENWQGASGWSDQYSIYQFAGLKLKNIYEEFDTTSILFFENGEIFKAEPYYENNIPRAQINKLLITKYKFNGEKYEPADQEIYPLIPDMPES